LNLFRNNIRRQLSQSINGRLDMPSNRRGNHTRIDNPQILDSEDAKIRVSHFPH